MKPLAAEQRAIPTAGGESLIYHVAGAGPPLLFCSGLAASWRGFRGQIAHFHSGFRCIAWDYRRLFRDGAPGGAALTVSEHAADALAILEQEGVSTVAVIGWSFGAQVALELFSQAPDRVAALVLVGGGARASWADPDVAGPLRRQYPKLFAALTRAPELLELLLLQASRSPESLTWLRRLGLAGRGLDTELFGEVLRDLQRVDAAALLKTLEHMREVDLSPVLPKVDVPTLVIGGDRDPFTSRSTLEHLVNSVKGAEYLLLPGGTHYVLMDHAEHVNLRIRKFFNERGYG